MSLRTGLLQGIVKHCEDNADLKCEVECMKEKLEQAIQFLENTSDSFFRYKRQTNASEKEIQTCKALYEKKSEEVF